MQVVALIHEENGVFGASFPDFLGCTTVANSLDGIMPKAAEALAFHVEGMVDDGLALPPVRTLTQLRNDPIFREDSAGAMVALVPYAPPTRATRVNITFDQSLLERVDRAADAAGETRSGYWPTPLAGDWPQTPRLCQWQLNSMKPQGHSMSRTASRCATPLQERTGRSPRLRG